MQRERASAASSARVGGGPTHTRPRRLDGRPGQPVNAVRDLEDATVGGEALRREARDQSGAGPAAQREGELPSEVVGVVEAGVRALAPEGA
jgi:hypothetical protein